MPLHRDIHWLGRQWAVTGHGLQLINQKQMGYYDIEAARLWEARVSEVQSKAWIDRPDFDKALEIARGKFAQLAPADWPPPAAVAAPPSPVRPAAPRTHLDAASVPSIEELLARLKSKSAAPPPVAGPAEVAPAPPQQPVSPKLETTRPDTLTPETPTLEPRNVEPVGSELLKSELPKPPRPEARRVETPKVEAEPTEAEPAKTEPAKTEPAQREAPKLESPEPEPVRPEALKGDLPQAPARKLELPPLVPVIKSIRKPAWPVFDRKIAGSGKFLQPWRVTSASWRGPSSGLPRRL